jgi:hypothetical protein
MTKSKPELKEKSIELPAERREGVNVMTKSMRRSAKVKVHKAVTAFGRSSKSYNHGCWDCTDARLWFNVIRYVIEDWIGEHNKESAEDFLFGRAPKFTVWRETVCESAGIHPDSLIRFATALKAETQKPSYDWMDYPLITKGQM